MEDNTKGFGELNVSRGFEMEERQRVTQVRCSDARDEGAIETEAKQQLTIEYAARGIDVIVKRVNSAGSKVYAFSVQEIMQLQVDGMDEDVRQFGSIEIFQGRNPVHVRNIVQITGHADVCVECPDHESLSQDVNKVTISDPHSPFNCGMSHASEFWGKVEGMILDIGAKVKFYDKQKKEYSNMDLKTHEDLLKLLTNTYLYVGNDVAGFITSIDPIRTPLESKNFLRQKINNNVRLGNIPITINASVLNYGTGQDIRTDGNMGAHTILDDVSGVTSYVMAQLPDDHPEKVARMGKQKPICVLVCPPKIQSPRDLIMDYHHHLFPKTQDGMAGSVFLTQGIDVDKPTSVYGPYKLLGNIYSIVALGVRKFYLLGEDKLQADLMEAKLRNDPLMNIVLNHFNVELVKVALHEVSQYANLERRNLDRETLDLINEGMKKFPKHPLSPLNKPAKFERVLELRRGY